MQHIIRKLPDRSKISSINGYEVTDLTYERYDEMIGRHNMIVGCFDRHVFKYWSNPNDNKTTIDLSNLDDIVITALYVPKDVMHISISDNIIQTTRVLCDPFISAHTIPSQYIRVST